MSHFKIKLSVLLCIIIFFVSCTQSTEIKNSELNGNNFNDKFSNEDYTYVSSVQDDWTINIYDQVKRDQLEMNEFLQVLKDRFDIDLKFNMVPLDWQDPVIFSNIQGIVKINVFQYKQLLSEQDSIFLPLDNLVDKNDVLNNMPRQYLNSVMNADGNIVGVYLGHRYFIPVRLYNKEIMDEVNLDIPENPNELMVLLKRVQREYNNTDLSIMEFSPESPVIPLNDLFVFNGGKIYDSRYTIGWDPETQSFEDSVLNADIEYILNYSKQLIDEKLLTVSTERTIRDKYIENKLFTINDFLSNNYLLPGRIGFSLGEKNITILENDYKEMYVIPSNMENGETIFSEFVSAFYGDPIINIYGRFGINFEYSVSRDFKEVTVKSRNEWGEERVSLIPRLTAIWPNIPYTIFLETETEDEKNGKAEAESIYYQQLNNLIEKNMIIFLSPLQAIDVNERNYMYGNELDFEHINNLFSIEYRKFLSGNVSASAFFENYCNQMKKLNAEEYIDWLNERVRSFRLYSY